ncbi:cyclopropane-fatty-acyl-phospholipid synthase family protein [uncultured Chloroflexus sp.]|uniref:SAM-dependent methyltransferase n=1 Tax=uncultured Chloroflexus sp. TaxID=214040 RepID=UPI0026311BE9|nr:class I SAM-dependent methyltransferase [uncultured Chloroflexus sp.]
MLAIIMVGFEMGWLMGLLDFIRRGRAHDDHHSTDTDPVERSGSVLSMLSEEDKRKLFEEFRSKMMYDMFVLTHEGRPNCNQALEKFRNLPGVQWNIKVLGAELASRYYINGEPDRQALLNDPFIPNCRATRFEDFLQSWFIDTCKMLKLAPRLHRKLWEEVYVVNVLKHKGKLIPGCRGIVFGVGRERLPSFFASMGVDILATDLDPNNDASQGWIATDQHGSLDRLYFKEYLEEEQFRRHVSFQYADMNNIPPELEGQFDFCWSICAFEHLGSIENGLAFVRNTGRLLKKGGVSVHTTEFNYTRSEETIDNWATVLFRRKDFELLANQLKESGYEVPHLSFDVGSTPVDLFIDIPPYPQHKGDYYDERMSSLHLKLLVDGFPATCYGFNFSRV